jgi:hypothetical protein
MHDLRLAIGMTLCAALLSLGAQRLAAQGTATKSISAWVKCGGIEDASDGVARAFQAARHSAFTLLVDCPVRVHIGTDIARTIFIDDGTSVEFSGGGKLIIDNVFHPHRIGELGSRIRREFAGRHENGRLREFGQVCRLRLERPCRRGILRSEADGVACRQS